MRYREKYRVDWDEEIRKTERIRRNGLFISAIGIGVALLFIVGVNRAGIGFEDIGRRVIFALCFVLSMLLMSIVGYRRARLKREKKEREEEQIIQQIQQIRQRAQKAEQR